MWLFAAVALPNLQIHIQTEGEGDYISQMWVCQVSEAQSTAACGTKSWQSRGRSWPAPFVCNFAESKAQVKGCGWFLNKTLEIGMLLLDCRRQRVPMWPCKRSTWRQDAT